MAPDDINQTPTEFNNQQAEQSAQQAGVAAASTGSVAAAAVAASQVAMATPVPSVAGSTTIDWGSWAEQLIKNETAVIEGTVQGGVTMALSAVPFGNIIAGFIGPTVVKQYVDQALVVLEGVLADKSTTINSSNTLETYVISMIQNEAPILSAFIGAALPGLVQKALGSVGL